MHKISDAAERKEKVAQSQYGERPRHYSCGVKRCSDMFLWEANLLVHLVNEHNIELHEATKFVTKLEESQDQYEEDNQPDEEESGRTERDVDEDGEGDGEVAVEVDGEESVGQDNEESHIVGGQTAFERQRDAFLATWGYYSK
jgi:hypothetical protein